MTSEQFEQLNIMVKQSIKDTVNGKIDRLNDKIDTYIKDDNEWKDRAQPSLDVINNARGFSKTILYVAAIAGAVFGLIKTIKAILKL